MTEFWTVPLRHVILTQCDATFPWTAGRSSLFSQMNHCRQFSPRFTQRYSSLIISDIFLLESTVPVLFWFFNSAVLNRRARECKWSFCVLFNLLLTSSSVFICLGAKILGEFWIEAYLQSCLLTDCVCACHFTTHVCLCCCYVVMSPASLSNHILKPATQLLHPSNRLGCNQFVHLLALCAALNSICPLTK